MDLCFIPMCSSDSMRLCLFLVTVQVISFVIIVIILWYNGSSWLYCFPKVIIVIFFIHVNVKSQWGCHDECKWPHHAKKGCLCSFSRRWCQRGRDDGRWYRIIYRFDSKHGIILFFHGNCWSFSSLRPPHGGKETKTSSRSTCSSVTTLLSNNNPPHIIIGVSTANT